jgi:transposase-like protein
MLIAENSIFSLTKGYEGGAWYPKACQFLNLDHHHTHSSYEKSIIERTIRYIKDRTESFDDYFPCSKENCKLKNVQNWLTIFLSMHNKEVINA